MPEFVHKPVMLQQVLQALMPREGGRYVDGTLGGAGHAAAILEASAPTGWLYGFDRDGAAIEAAKNRLAAYAGRFELRLANYRDMDRWIDAGSCDGVLLDLGVSSPQLDQADRGFSFQQDGPLDMRMDQTSGPTAADLVNSLPPEELAPLFRKLGEEPQAWRFAKAIEAERQVRKFERTLQLAGLIERLAPRRGARTHPATRVFQALRMAVNDELGSLEQGLVASLRILKTGGRLAVITFHSLEDRMVKEFGREKERDYDVPGDVDVPELRVPKKPELRRVHRKPLEADPREIAENPRSRSAKLRVFEKI